MLVDAFLQSLNAPYYRMHFHEFMLDFHRNKNQLKLRRNPVLAIVKRIRQHYAFLFLDEFIVLDIADAMILREFLFACALTRLFIFTTSNSPPADLYQDGFQRKLFLPTIAHLEKTFMVRQLGGAVDYRYRKLSGAIAGWKFDRDDSWVDEWFSHITDTKPSPQEIFVNDHSLKLRGITEEYLLVEFDAIAGGRRAASDYVTLAKKHNVMIIKSIPATLDDSRSNAVRRFINLVDVWYDYNRVILLTHSLTQWYAGRLENEMKRTKSRLQEMRQLYSSQS